MIQIIFPSAVHVKDIADFQCRMAMQTEKLQLNRQKVQKAVQYLIKHPKYGQYYLSVLKNQPEKVCGSLLITYENQKSYWVQSVYVRQEHRRKGIFTNMFKTMTKQCRQNGVKSLQLFIQKQNQKAKLTYQSLGLHCNNNQFIGYEFVYGNTQSIKHLQQDVKEPFKVSQFKENQLQKEINDELKHISGKFSNLNNILVCYQHNEIISCCQYFTEFSDWRFGLSVYISYFCSKEKMEKVALQNFVKYLRKNLQIQVATIRIIGSEDQVKKLKQIETCLKFDVYNVMIIQL